MIKSHKIVIFIDDNVFEYRLPYKRKYYIACDINNKVYIHYDYPKFKNGYHISVNGKYFVGMVDKCDDYTRVYKNKHEKAIGYKSMSRKPYEKLLFADLELNKTYYTKNYFIVITNIKYDNNILKYELYRYYKSTNIGTKHIFNMMNFVYKSFSLYYNENDFEINENIENLLEKV